MSAVITTDFDAAVCAVADAMSVTAADILADHRGPPDVARTRWMAFAVWRDHKYGRSGRVMKLTEIGRHFGRDRTTVRHGLKRFLDECAADKGYLRTYQDVMERLG